MVKAPSYPGLQALRRLAFPEVQPIRSCIYRSAHATLPSRPSQPPQSQPPPPKPHPAQRAIAIHPGDPRISVRQRPDDDEDFLPQPLPRPIGISHPPQPGTNLGIDTRSFTERRDDFVDYDKHLAKRARMTAQIAKPYFRDWSNLRFHRGKLFLAPERLFRGEASLWFPNFYGKTLAKSAMRREGAWRKDGYGGFGRDTTLALKGKVSVVSIVSSMWASAQVDTFCAREKNPALWEILQGNKDVAQMVWVNHETNMLKWWLLQMFRGNLRKDKTETEQGRYFMVRRGVNEEIKEAIGLLNDKVGFVYLVDAECRIRWAGCADAAPHELESMIRGLRRLIQDVKTPAAEKVDSQQQLADAVADAVQEPRAATA